jgi:hypothetical protein
VETETDAELTKDVELNDIKRSFNRNNYRN